MFHANSPDSFLSVLDFFGLECTAPPVGFHGILDCLYAKPNHFSRWRERACRFRVSLWASPRETAEVYSNESVLSTIAIFQFENSCLAYTHLSTYSVSPICSTTLEPERRLSLRPPLVGDVGLAGSSERPCRTSVSTLRAASALLAWHVRPMLNLSSGRAGTDS